MLVFHILFQIQCKYIHAFFYRFFLDTPLCTHACIAQVNEAYLPKDLQPSGISQLTFLSLLILDFNILISFCSIASQRVRPLTRAATEHQCRRRRRRQR